MDTPVKETNAVTVDLLGRQDIVDRIMKILQVISENKSSCTFALNGAWGTGKTFVLNMLMNQLWDSYSEKFIVFHYNCWQYDYYEEPLIAIVAAILDSLDEEKHLLPENIRAEVKVGIDFAKKSLKKIALELVKNKIGVDFTEALSAVDAYQLALENEEQVKEDSRSFDTFYSFKKAIKNLQEEIQKLAEERTIVIVVDELDRCLPSYAIKVLERLHHLFDGVDNISVLISVDKDQLDATVMQIFGNKTNVGRYLHKFITFELNLDNGSISGDFRKKYGDYFDLFDETIIETDFPYNEFLMALFSGINSREQEQLMNRIKTVHKLLFPNTKKDYSIMCCELMWLVLNKDQQLKSNPFYAATDGYGLNCFKFGYNEPNKMRQFVDSCWSHPYIGIITGYSNIGNKNELCGDGKIQKLLIYYFEKMIPSNTPQYFVDSKAFPEIDLEQNVKSLKAVRDTLFLIR